MKLSEFKKNLEVVEQLDFVLQNGQKVPSNFHITEVGMTTKQFTDCGNSFRVQKKATLQLWTSEDFYHRLEPKKVMKIIESTEHFFDGEDLEMEVEYKQETVCKFDLKFIDNQFVLVNTRTDCLAKTSCGIVEKVKVKLSEIMPETACCSPNSNCC